MRRFLGVVAFGEQVRNLSVGQACALQRRTDFALAFWAMATGTFGFIGGGAVLRERRQSQRYRQRDDEQHDEHFGESHEFSFGSWNVGARKSKRIVVL